MRYFEVLGIQHFFMYLFPAIATIALFIIGLGFYHFNRKDSAEREARVIARDQYQNTVLEFGSLNGFADYSGIKRHR